MRFQLQDLPLSSLRFPPFPLLPAPSLSLPSPCQVLQQHFNVLLKKRLSPLLQLTLELLLEGMDSSSLAAVLWRDLRSVMRVNKESDLLVQTMLPVQEVWSRMGVWLNGVAHLGVCGRSEQCEEVERGGEMYWYT